MTPSRPILVINGPNLNMLGVREPELYGSDTLNDIQIACTERATAVGESIDFRQSNSEAEILGWLQAARNESSGIIINPAAFTHTSVAILDALIITELPIIEVHISNIFSRESFRQHSYISQAATGVISGFGSYGYVLAIDALIKLIRQKKET